MMKPLIGCLILGIYSTAAIAQADTAPKKIPFEGYDLTWINGQNREKDQPLTLTNKQGEVLCTGIVFMDGYYNYNFNNPIDNTHNTSSSIGRSNEFTLNMASVGLETNYKNVVGRLLLQYGQMTSIVQDLDGTVTRGRNTALANLRNVREAAAGYHFSKWYGINVEMGIFMSYIGLESYVMNENWSYQRSVQCDMTPFYFSGARIQAHPSKKLKQEILLLNGWQTYNSWNQGIGVGSSTYWRPTTNVQLAANFYLAGKDTRNAPGVARYHHDHSAVVRYYKKEGGKGVSQAAFSINNHYGFQQGGGVSSSANYMAGTSVAHRVWWGRNKYAITIRGDYVTNPGAYVAFTPAPVVTNDYTDALAAGKTLSITQGTLTFDVMPNDYFTFRVEYGYRAASVPYFAGKGGTTSPDGWQDTPTATWRPDLVKTENRLTAAMCFRL
jgi:hypothetical protein